MPLRERPADNDVLEARVTLTEDDARETARLLRLLSDAVGLPFNDDGRAGEAASAEMLVARARLIFHGRLARAQHFNRAMFGEPAWDIMLALYINHHGGSRLTATSIADMIEQPFSTVVRWIDYLEKERLIDRKTHPNDKRVSIISLLEKGRESMDCYLRAAPALL